MNEISQAKQLRAQVPRRFNLCNKIHERLEKKGVIVSKRVIFNVMEGRTDNVVILNELAQIVNEYVERENKAKISLQVSIKKNQLLTQYAS